METRNAKVVASKIVLFVKRDIRMEFRFSIDLFTRFLGMFVGVAGSYYLSRLLGSGAAVALSKAGYKADYLSFLILGAALTAYMNLSLHSFYWTMQSSWASGTIQFMLSTRTKLWVYLVGKSMWRYLDNTLNIAFNILIGVALFGLTFSTNANYLGAAVLTVLAIVALLGLSLFSATAFTLLNAVAGTEPVTWTIDLLVPLVAGVAYPREMLPGPLRTIGAFLPQTYALRGVRRALLQGDSLPALWQDVVPLVLFGLVVLPLGAVIFRKALRIGLKSGMISPW